MTSQGGDLGIQSTPSFIINGQRIGGAQPIEVFREVIDAELAQQ
jgi:protein-disulfide isomerase